VLGRVQVTTARARAPCFSRMNMYMGPSCASKRGQSMTPRVLVHAEEEVMELRCARWRRHGVLSCDQTPIYDSVRRERADEAASDGGPTCAH
jgi:hypothetical protein